MDRKDIYAIALDEISRHTRPPIHRREHLATRITNRIEAALKAEAEKPRAGQAEAVKQ